ncbi:MAG TPA: L,D-transpeptidase [Thermoanaerobaculia bacterium]|nr:L,D-transpeptidase [Thermoanaerobaculia bacterium]
MVRSVALLCFLVLAAAPVEAASHRNRGRRSSRPRSEAALDPARVNDPGTAPTIAMGARGDAVLRAQILLDRQHFSCGEIDATYGRNLRGAVIAFQTAQGQTPTGVVDTETWSLLDRDDAPVLVTRSIAPEDVAGPFTPLPEDFSEKARLPALGYASPLEALAEKYHVSPSLLQRLNPGQAFDQAGAEILVPDVAAAPLTERAAKIVVSEEHGCVEALDDTGHVIAHYPASTGSHHDPLPLGSWKIVGVAHNPVFHYDPDLFWDATDRNKEVLPAGPNNPVGVCWIDLSKPHYGIHGTPEPSKVGRTQSHGCIRLTNWNVLELAQIVRPGTPAILEK